MSRAEQEARAVSLGAGTRLGPYEILDLLGAGGMGEVYRAFDPRLGREVAIKVLPPEVACSPERLARFEREARAVAALSHPNILTIFDVGTAEPLSPAAAAAAAGPAIGSVPYVVAELLEGETLREVSRRRGPAQRQVLSFAVQIAQGLAAAHAKGIVHRDVKPENVFVTTDGRVKLLDFGLAKLAEHLASDAGTDSSPTAAGQVLGTVGYMSPEQVRGLAVDARTDIFSFGVLLYELLSGRQPFRRDTAVATLTAILEEQPAELSKLARGVPPALSGIVRRCIEKERDERFGSARDLAFALEAVLQAPVGSVALQEIEEKSPYPGLASFTEKEAAFFFGREQEIEALWERLASRKLLAVIGPSGAGKTSFVRAGVIPARPQGWAAVFGTPGRNPALGLARALTPELAGDAEAISELLSGVTEIGAAGAERVISVVKRWRDQHAEALVVLDQFEELFTLNGADAQQQFSELLDRLVAEADVHVLLSLRDDFLLRCSEQPALAAVFESLTPLRGLSDENLRRALLEPARKRGYRFEDEAQAGELLASVAGTRGALPLLAFAVSRLWEKRDRERKLLTRAVYEQIGGVAGALAQHAEATLDRIGPARHAMVREIFRGLVTAQGTRAVVDREELLSAFEERSAAEGVLGELVEARLLTSYEVEAVPGRRGGRRVEMVHESLLKAWPRLVRWQMQDAEGAVLRDQLRQAAQLWADRGRTSDLLWSGTTFREFELWRERYQGSLTDVEEDFARSMAEKARRHRRLLTAGIATLIVGLAAVAIAIALSRDEAARARDLAREQALRATASKLVALGRVELDRYPTAALAYARRSLELTDTAEGRLLAIEALWRGPMARIAPVPGVMGLRLDFSQDDRWLAVAGFGTSLALLSDEGRVRRTVGVQATGALRSVAFDGAMLLTGSPRDPAVRGYDLEGRLRAAWPVEGYKVTVEPESGPVAVTWRDGEFVGYRLPRGGGPPAVAARWKPHRRAALDASGIRFETAFAGGLERCAYALDRDVFVRRLAAAGPGPDARLGRHDLPVRAVGFDATAQKLVSMDDAGGLRLWSAAGDGPLATSAGPLLHRYSLLRFDPRGRLVAWSAGRERTSCVWDTTAAPALALRCFARTDVRNVGEAAFDHRGRWLATADATQVAFWPLGSPRAHLLTGHLESPLSGLAFSPDSQTLASCARDGVRLWPLAPAAGPPRRLTIGAADAWCYGLAWAPSGRELAVTIPLDGVVIVPVDGRPRRRALAWPDNRTALGPVAFDADGRRLAVASFYGPEARHMRVYEVQLETGVMRSVQLRATDGSDVSAGAVESIAFADDGRVVYGGQGGVHAWDPASGRTTLLAGGADAFATVALDARRRRAFVALGSAAVESPHGRPTRLLAIDLASGARTTIEARPEALVAALSVDDARGRIVTADAAGRVRVAPASGGPPHLLLGHSGPVSRVAVSPDGHWIAAASAAEIRLWPAPDMSRPPLQVLPFDELMARLRSLTNLEVVEDASSPTGYRLTVGPFPGWRDVPAW